MYYLGLCCIAKDEDLFLKEWIAYHALLGVERFFIYDNESARPIHELLETFADKSRISVIRIPGRMAQVPAYQHCLDNFGSQCRWIGFLDVDEFALPMQDQDLRLTLSEFEPYAALAATWHLMSPSGHLRRPAAPVIKAYNQAFAAQESFHVKCFVQPAKTVQAHGPHSFFYKEGECAVNEEGYPLPPVNHYTFALGRKIRVNHYFVRSQQDFADKLRRGRADGSSAVDWTMFYEAAAKAWVEDEAMLRHVPALEAALARDRLPPMPARLPARTPYEELMEAAMAMAAAGKTDKAQALLCGCGPEVESKAEYWLLRSLLAGRSGHGDREAVFLRQAMLRDTLPEAFARQAELFRSQGRNDLALAINTMLGHLSGHMERFCRGVTLESWRAFMAQKRREQA